MVLSWSHELLCIRVSDCQEEAEYCLEVLEKHTPTSGLRKSTEVEKLNALWDEYELHVEMEYIEKNSKNGKYEKQISIPWSFNCYHEMQKSSILEKLFSFEHSVIKALYSTRVPLLSSDVFTTILESSALLSSDVLTKILLIPRNWTKCTNPDRVRNWDFTNVADLLMKNQNNLKIGSRYSAFLKWLFD